MKATARGPLGAAGARSGGGRAQQVSGPAPRVGDARQGAGARAGGGRLRGERSIRPALRSPRAPTAAIAAEAATSAPRIRWRSPIFPTRRDTARRSSPRSRCATSPRRPKVAGRSISRAGQRRRLCDVTADLVVLAAGTLGSTEILLRSREQGLAVSDRLGRSFSANGDIIAFGYGARLPVNAIGVGIPPRSRGSTSALRFGPDRDRRRAGPGQRA